MHDLYKKTYALVLLATQNPAIAKKAGTAAQTAMVGPVRSIQNFLPCAAKNISENLFGSIRNILGSFLNNVKNFTDCIGDQFVGAIFNDVIKHIMCISDLIGVDHVGLGSDYDGVEIMPIGLEDIWRGRNPDINISIWLQSGFLP